VRTEAPILLLQGQADTIVPILLTNALYERLCDVGSQVDYRVFEGFGHNESTKENMPLLMEWTAARFAGDPATTTCQ
jgi:predicted esterase